MGAGLDNRTVRNWRFRGFTGMDDEPEITAIDVDELWLREWAGEGLAELGRYLAKRAAFADFLRERGEG